MRPTKKQRIIANAFQRHLNQWHGADYPVCKDYICRFAWRLECQDRVNNCQHDTVTDLGDGLYGCLDCGWFDDAGTPGKRALIVGHPGELWFWSDEWQAKEREADDDLAAGRYRDFDNVDDMIAFLDNPPQDDDPPPPDSIRWFAPFM